MRGFATAMQAVSSKRARTSEVTSMQNFQSNRLRCRASDVPFLPFLWEVGSCFSFQAWRLLKALCKPERCRPKKKHQILSFKNKCCETTAHFSAARSWQGVQTSQIRIKGHCSVNLSYGVSSLVALLKRPVRPRNGTQLRPM